MIKFDRDTILDIINTASKFTSNKLNISNALQGIYIIFNEKKVDIYATNLTTFYHAHLNIVSSIKNKGVIIEPRKIIEFLQLLQSGDIIVELKEKQFVIMQDKTKGVFPIILSDEFPFPPHLEEKAQEMKKTFLTDNLPFILFTASTDDARPVLTGINFVATDEELAIVSTDGFRLSLVKEKRKGVISSMIIPAEFLQEVLKAIKTAKKISFTHSLKEKIIVFNIDDTEFYSRLIDGEFPPYERVIPTEFKTKIVLNHEEFLRNTKLISIFARDYSNVILYEFGKNGLTLKPKEEGGKENETTQDTVFEGEPQKVAFNYKYIVDFLNHINTKEIVVEILRPDAPVVFKAKGNETFVHIIMPVRIQNSE